MRVALVPSKRGNLLLYQVATLSAGAQFEFAYVAPGDYKVFALKNLPNGAEKSSEFLAPYEALGIPITVSVDSTREVGVPLIRND